ncbi:hypothetical protein KDD93_08760 [Campylobacter sp. faydin G-24]|uniref:Uncharacterized protein n=1 Tax=Campylobacter anatolicus TaxID=2829105 RepID=A0ABS5HK58_9BACT|nr:hypothetical protein [Campylobacter anatolicus]
MLTHKDRLLRFGVELVFSICEPNATKPVASGFKETQVDFSNSDNLCIRVRSNYSGSDYGLHWFAIGLKNPYLALCHYKTY